MGLLNTLKNLFSPQKNIPIPQRKPYIINNLEVNEGDFYDKVYPWADKKIQDDGLVISDLILLWVFKRLGTKFQTYPVHLSRNYGVHDIKDRLDKLVKLGLISPSYTVTDLGTNTINKHQNYIDLHKKGWISEEDAKKNKENHLSYQKETADWLESLGMHDSALELKNRIKSNQKRTDLYKVFTTGEELGKKKQFSKSNEILLPLLQNNELDFSAPLCERIAKNYRGLKEYQSEIDICNQFLTEFQPSYGGDMWVDVFTKRIEYAKKRLK